MLPIHQLSIGRAFNGLTDKEKLYAHHLSKAAWAGTRIIFRQVSPEANTIFDLIMELHRSCQQSFNGRWHDLGRAYGVPVEEVNAFLDYAAVFLSNIGNFYVRLFMTRIYLMETILKAAGLRRSEISAQHDAGVPRGDLSNL